MTTATSRGLPATPASEPHDPSRASFIARLAPLLVFFLPLTVYNLGHRYLGSGDTVPAELIPIAVLTHGTLDLREFSPSPVLPYWFRRVNGRVVSFYPILPGLVNVPVYAAARAAGLGLYERRFRLSHYTASLLAAFSALFLYSFLRKRYGSMSRALGFSLAYAFGTCVWSVAGHGLFQHGPALFFLAAALALIAGGRPAGVAFSGACLALAVLARPTNALLAAPLAIFVALRHRRRLPAFLALAAVPAALHVLYTWTYLGTGWSSGQPIPPGSFVGDPWQGLAGLLVSPSRGLFVFSPFLFFAVPAAVAAFRRSVGVDHLLERCLAVGTLGVLAVYARWPIWWGGHSFAYRIITELSLPLVVLVASDWPRIERSATARVLFASSLAFSVLVQGIGSFVYPSRFNATVDTEPWTLWDVRGSELVLSIDKLLKRSGAREGLGFRGNLAPDLAEDPPPPRPRWWDHAHEDQSIPLSVDSPRREQIVLGTLTVHGWAQPRPEDPGQVWITLAPGALEGPGGRFPRRDVARAFPGFGDGALSGYGARFEPPSPHLRRYTLIVEVRAADGGVRRSLPRSFLWGPARRRG